MQSGPLQSPGRYRRTCSVARIPDGRREFIVEKGRTRTIHRKADGDAGWPRWVVMVSRRSWEDGTPISTGSGRPYEV